MFGEKENTEERILKATFNILQQEGVDRTTTKKIAAEAGVNEVTIFRKFENKNNLIETAKAHYIKLYIDKLEETFAFSEDDEMEEYFRKAFYKMLDFEEDDVNIVRVVVGDVRGSDEKKNLISQITEPVFNKLEEFFKLQIKKGTVRDINPNAAALLCYGLMFQSLILWQVHGAGAEYFQKYTNEDFLDIIYHGIKP